MLDDNLHSNSVAMTATGDGDDEEYYDSTMVTSCDGRRRGRRVGRPPRCRSDLSSRASCVRSRLSVAHPRSMSQSSLRAPHLAAVHMTRPFQIDRSMHCRNSRRRCDDDVAHRPSRSTSILPRLPCQSWCISEAMSTKTTALRPLPESIIDIETFDSAKIAIKDCGPGIGRRVDVDSLSSM